MKNYLDFEKEIKELEKEVDTLKSPFGSEGISEVDTDKIRNTEQEINQICYMALGNLQNYIDKIQNHHNTEKEEDVIKAQNYYCEHQQQNPHTPRVMQTLGLPEEHIKLFCQDNLFPKII